MTDVLILYESRSREIENSVLLASELELRGYKVKIKNIYDPYKYFVKPKVLVVPHIYNEEQLMMFGRNFWKSNKNIISLQYEQVLGVEVTEDNVHNPKGQAQKAHHIAWGEEQANRYVKFHINPENVHKTGSMAMDLMRDEFSDYFMSRSGVARNCGLKEDAEWVLFVSSFSYANLTEEDLKRLEKLSSTARVFSKLSDESFGKILDWLKAAAKKYPEKEFIYRPHPAEKVSEKVKKLAEIPNIHVIGDYSMRQWAKVSDKIYNWFSTSIADIYFAQKSCYIIRPVEIPRSLEVAILDGAKTLNNYEAFEKSIENNEFDFPVPNETMEYYYGGLNGRMAYQQIADVCVGLIKGDLKGYDYNWGSKSRFNIGNIDSISKAIAHYATLPFYSVCVLFNLKNAFWPFKGKQHYVRLYDADIYNIENDIRSYKERLFSIIKKNFQPEA